jgi:hypothetical protein
MKSDFANALTPCPACGKPAPLAAAACPHCNAPADTTSSFLSFRRPDGSAGMIDQETASFFRSTKPLPAQADIDQLFTTASRVQFLELIFENRTGAFVPRLTLTAEQLPELRQHLQIHESLGHLMTFPQHRLDFYAADALIASVQIVAAFVLRWPDRWKTDAQLSNPRSLAAFLNSHGYPNLLQQITRAEEDNRRQDAARAAWLATWTPAIPDGLAPFLDRLVEETHDPSPRTLPYALNVLSRHYPNPDEKILILFAWYGHARGPWSGFPSVESVAEFLLRSFTLEQQLHALQSRPLTPQHLEGAARFLAYWNYPSLRNPNVPQLAQLLPGALREQLLTHLRAQGDAAKLRQLLAAFS